MAQPTWLPHPWRCHVGHWAGARAHQQSCLRRAHALHRSDSRSRRRKSEAEQVFAELPAIIEPETFERVQSLLKERNPRITPPRVVSGPILLTGLAVCASCRGAMTLRTGTSRNGLVHRYYTCSTCAREGKTACKGRSIRMDKLDTLVTTHLADRLLEPQRLTEMLTSLASKRAAKAAAVDTRIATLEREAHEANERLRRLYKLVENGVADMDDLLKDRITALKADRDASRAALDRAKCGTRPAVNISSLVIEEFGRTMRDKFTRGEIPFRKAYLGAIVDRVEVDDREIRIVGRKDVLEQAVLGNGGFVPRVRSFVRKWRTGQDSKSRSVRAHAQDPNGTLEQFLHIEQLGASSISPSHFNMLALVAGVGFEPTTFRL